MRFKVGDRVRIDMDGFPAHRRAGTVVATSGGRPPVVVMTDVPFIGSDGVPSRRFHAFPEEVERLENTPILEGDRVQIKDTHPLRGVAGKVVTVVGVTRGYVRLRLDTDEHVCVVGLEWVERDPADLPWSTDSVSPDPQRVWFGAWRVPELK